MEENRKIKKKITSSPSSKTIQTNNQKQKSPIQSKSKKTLQNIYDDTDIQKTHQQQIPTSIFKNKSNKISKNNQNISATPHKQSQKQFKSSASTPKKITFQAWLLQNKTPPKVKINTKNDVIQEEKPKMRYRKYYPKKDIENQQQTSEEEQTNQKKSINRSKNFKNSQKQLENQQLSNANITDNQLQEQNNNNHSNNNYCEQDQHLSQKKIRKRRKSQIKTVRFVTQSQQQKQEEEEEVQKEKIQEEIEKEESENEEKEEKKEKEEVEQEKENEEEKEEQAEQQKEEDKVKEENEEGEEEESEKKEQDKNEQLINSSEKIKYDDQQQIDKAQNSSIKSSNSKASTQSNCFGYLNYIFNYYCKMHYTIGKGTTFDEIKQKTTIMLINNYMKFCQDFNLRSYLSRNQLLYIFNKYSTFQKYLTCSQFKQTITILVSSILKKTNSNQNYSIFQFLQIENSTSFINKMNKLGIAFRLQQKKQTNTNTKSKYTSRLTAINGKTNDDLQNQALQRYHLRKINKQSRIQYHKNNRKNKIENLYQNALQNSRNTKCISRKFNKQNQTNYQLKPCTTGYYNPCSILTQKQDKNYQLLHQIKKKQKLLPFSRINTERRNKLTTEYRSLSSLNRQRQMKLNSVISDAKNNALMKNRDIFSLSQMRSMSRNKQQSGIIKKQFIVIPLKKVYSQSMTKFIQTFARSELENCKDRQLAQQQFLVTQQIKNIQPTLIQSQARLKKYSHVYDKIDHQYAQQINQLKQMIITNQDEDELLTQHFNIQAAFQSNINARNHIK